MLSVATIAPSTFVPMRAPLMNIKMEAVAVEPETPAPFDPVEFAKSLPGASAPLGFFDPMGFCQGDVSEGRIRFYREVEVKHARVAMLAAVGFAYAEGTHPLFGGDIDVPSYIAFQETPLQTFWPAVVLLISFAEVFSVFTFQNPSVQTWAISPNHMPGNFNIDPMGFVPKSGRSNFLAEMQTKELNNGRLAMIAIAGMVGQELATGSKLF